MDKQDALLQLRRDLEREAAYTEPSGRTALQVEIRQKEGLRRIKRMVTEAIRQDDTIKIMILCSFLSSLMGIPRAVLTLQRLNDAIHKQLDELELIIE